MEPEFKIVERELPTIYCALLDQKEGPVVLKNRCGVQKKMIELTGRNPPLPKYLLEDSEDDEEGQEPLSSVEFRIAMRRVKNAGEEGIALSEPNCFLKLKKWGKVEKEYLCVEEEEVPENVKILHFICMKEGCFMLSPKPSVDSGQALCVNHRGDITKFALLRFEIQQPNGKTEFSLVNFEYFCTQETEEQDFAVALKEKIGNREPKEIEKFESEVDLDEGIAIHGTVCMLISLFNPRFEFNQGASLANGLEKEVEKELKKRGYFLKMTQYGMNLNLETNLLIKPKNQSPVAKKERIDSGDYIPIYLSYTKEYQVAGQNCQKTGKEWSQRLKFEEEIVALTDPEEIENMENCFITAVYLSCLFNLPNPFNKNDPGTRPYLLNTSIDCPKFTSKSWEIIRLMLKHKYNVNLTASLVNQEDPKINATERSITPHASSSKMLLVQPVIDKEITPQKKASSGVLEEEIEKKRQRLEVEDVNELEQKGKNNDKGVQAGYDKFDKGVQAGWICLKCKICYLDEETRDKHMQTHLKSICKLCNFRFECEDSLKLHISNEHFACVTCKEIFRTPGDLGRHYEDTDC